MSTGAVLGYFCVAAGFLIVVASVVFVIKGKAVLNESGTLNAFEWGKIKANLTSAVTLFVLGAVMIALPFWRLQEDEARLPATATLTGKIIGPGGRDVRLLLVAKPDYDQLYRGDIVWVVPLIAKRASYSVFYIDGGTILYQHSFSVEDAASGSPPQKVTLPELNLQIGSSTAQDIDPQKEVSDEELKSLGIP